MSDMSNAIFKPATINVNYSAMDKLGANMLSIAAIAWVVVHSQRFVLDQTISVTRALKCWTLGTVLSSNIQNAQGMSDKETVTDVLQPCLYDCSP